MNSLQIELNTINEKLELLTYRKNQLEPIIAEYLDVIERVKRLTDNMIALNIEPTNLRFDIEDILEGRCEPDATPEPTPEPQPVKMFAFVPGFPVPTPESDSNHEKINSYIIPFDPVLHGEP